jgi:hypothetical protein
MLRGKAEGGERGRQRGAPHWTGRELVEGKGETNRRQAEKEGLRWRAFW